MHLLIASYPAVSILEGGIRTQALSLWRELAQLGHHSDLFDPWHDYCLDAYDWFYIVGAHIGTVHLARAVKQLGLRLAISPVYFSRRRAGAVSSRTRLIDLARGATGMISESHLTREVCQLADVVLPNTQAEAELLTGGLRVRRSKVHVVPNGCEESFYDARPAAFVREFGREGFVLYVGHVGLGRKNLLGLLHAMKGIDRSLVIIGKVLDNAYARECCAAAKELKDCLVIPGLEHDSELLASAYAACDVFCLPSRFETPGLSALEAALAGAKIAITRYGGTQEYFGEFACYLEPAHDASIRTALEQALAAPKDKRLREHVRCNYLWRNAAERLVQCLAAQGAEIPISKSR